MQLNNSHSAEPQHVSIKFDVLFNVAAHTQSNTAVLGIAARAGMFLRAMF